MSDLPVPGLRDRGCDVATCKCICKHRHLGAINDNPHATGSDRLVVRSHPNCPVTGHGDRG